MPPALSVVIPVYDNWWLTARALRALEALRGDATGFETIVVDNASGDETPRAIGEFPWVRYERLERNRNFAGACNAGASLAQAPLVLFLNNDAYPLGNALTPLVRAFDREDVYIAGGALFFEDGPTQCAGFVVLPNAHWHFSDRNLPPTLRGVTRSRDALGVSGAAMAVRKQWFLDQGGFDESYVNGFEDVDLCMRARDERRVIRYVADARFAHYEAASAGRFAREAENERRFYRRWSTRFAGIPRTGRGELGAVVVRAAAHPSALSSAGLDDLEAALRSFGHPVMRGSPGLRQRIDRRFRTRATLEWFTPASGPQAGVAIGARAVMRAHGAVALEVPWLPCASAERVADLPLRHAPDPACAIVAIVGFDTLAAERKSETIAALDDLVAGNGRLQLVVISGDGGELSARYGERVSAIELAPRSPAPQPIGVACIVQAGRTDESAFGNVALAQAELPTIVLAESEPSELFADDVVVTAQPGGLAACIASLLADSGARVRYASSCAADARRRFSPRRSAIRVVDLLCAARSGLERPAEARTNTPLHR